jgi:hypothetical protein
VACPVWEVPVQVGAVEGSTWSNRYMELHRARRSDQALTQNDLNTHELYSKFVNIPVQTSGHHSPSNLGLFYILLPTGQNSPG